MPRVLADLNDCLAQSDLKSASEGVQTNAETPAGAGRREKLRSHFVKKRAASGNFREVKRFFWAAQNNLKSTQNEFFHICRERGPKCERQRAEKKNNLASTQTRPQDEREVVGITKAYQPVQTAVILELIRGEENSPQNHPS